VAQSGIKISQTNVNNWLRHPQMSLWRKLAAYLGTEAQGRRWLFGDLASLFEADAAETAEPGWVETVFSRIRQKIDALKTKTRQIQEALKEVEE
jgi:hypothetical protein